MIDPTSIEAFRELIARMREPQATQLVQGRVLHEFAALLEPIADRYGPALEDVARLDSKLIMVSDCIHKGGNLRTAIDKAIAYEADDKPPATLPSVCGCLRCARERKDGTTIRGEFIPSETYTMFVCATCGNKRCPHSDDHRNTCSGSNAPGQPGSRYTERVRNFG